MPLHKDLREFIESFNCNKVEYLIVGAFAVAWHGHPRFTADIDFFVRATPDNADAILAALRDSGFGSLQITREDLCEPGQILQLGATPNRIDILTSFSGVDFAVAWENRVPGTIDKIPVFYIGRDDLLANKESTGRPKDLGDADELRKRDPLGP